MFKKVLDHMAMQLFYFVTAIAIISYYVNPYINI